MTQRCPTCQQTLPVDVTQQDLVDASTAGARTVKHYAAFLYDSSDPADVERARRRLDRGVREGWATVDPGTETWHAASYTCTARHN